MTCKFCCLSLFARKRAMRKMMLDDGEWNGCIKWHVELRGRPIISVCKSIETSAGKERERRKRIRMKMKQRKSTWS